MANGVRQLEGVEYNQTFSSVVKPVSISLVLTIAISKGWSMVQIDTCFFVEKGIIWFETRTLVVVPMTKIFFVNSQFFSIH